MFIPLPVPAGVYGLFILLGGLCTKVISLSDVEVTGNLLLDLMPVMFIPAAVGIIDKIEELKVIMIPMLIITFVTTFIVMTITGKTAEWIIKRQKKRRNRNVIVLWSIYQSVRIPDRYEVKEKFGWPVLNPLLVAIIIVIAFLKATGISYTDYNTGASYISYF